jgi:hypothetical protein
MNPVASVSETFDATQPRPNFLIAGVPKAGTTSLYEYLRQHPQIFMPEHAKEPCYFVHGFGIEKWEKYIRLFKSAGEKKTIGEASSVYCFAKESPAWIKAVLGEIKIIILLRNPANRAFSLYGWMVREGYEDAPTFAEALDREADRLKDLKFQAESPQFLADYLYFTTGFYFEQIDRYLEIFGRDRVKVYLFEEFIKQPLAICQDVFRFLEVDDHFVPNLEVHNEGRIPKSIAFQYWLRSKMPRRQRGVLQKLQAKILWGLMDLNVRCGAKPQPDRALLDSMTVRYREDIERLQVLLDRDFSVWFKRKSG